MAGVTGGFCFGSNSQLVGRIHVNDGYTKAHKETYEFAFATCNTARRYGLMRIGTWIKRVPLK